MSGIYLVWNRVSGGIYVGSSTCIQRRLRTHFRELNAGTHTNPHLLAAWRRYGAAVFSVLVVEQVEPARLVERENEWLVFGTYNIAKVAGRPAGTKGYRFTEDQRRHMRVAAQTRRLPVDFAQRIKAGFTPEVRARMSAAKQGTRPPNPAGRAHSEATRAQMRASQRSRRQMEAAINV